MTLYIKQLKYRNKRYLKRKFEPENHHSKNGILISIIDDETSVLLEEM
jgi:hypothetical protein